MSTVTFGLHLTLDLYSCPENLLDDMKICYKAMDELPVLLGMRKLIPPYVISAEANNKKDPGGFSGFVIIAESHISIHTFTKRGFVSIDLYSCKDFDTDMAITYFKKIFKPKDIEIHIVKRGTRYPQHNIYK